MTMRLQKFLAQVGIASRRKAEELIVSGKIKINGAIVDRLGSTIDENNDKIEYQGRVLKLVKGKTYVALNKPVGYVCSASSRQGKSVLELVPKGKRIYPVGRLDKDSRGLVLLTDDGDLAYELTQASFEHEKEYEVELNKDFVKTDKAALEKGMVIDGKRVRGIGVRIASPRKLRLTLKEGVNRQIRKMLGRLGYGVIDLNRIRIGKLESDKLRIKTGEWKEIRKEDII